MTRKWISVVAGLFLITISVAVWYFTMFKNDSALFSDGFEAGMKNWERAFDLPDNPNKPGQKVDWRIVDSTAMARTGGRSLEMIIDGQQDDGTVWVQRSLMAPKVGEDVTVDLSFWSYSESVSFNTRSVVVASISDTPPVGEASFEVLGPSDVWVGWRRFNYSVALKPGDGGHVWVAFGISVRWETDISQYFDDIEIKLV